MPTPREWLNDFLAERNCENGRPDGRPLFSYRCSETEYEEIVEVLSEQSECAGIAQLQPRTDALFALYCAEWCRQQYDGGAWGWHRILVPIGWNFGDRRHIPWVESGIRYWGRQLFVRDRGTEFLYTLVAEGGIPNHLLSGQAGVFSGYLKALIDFRRRYGLYGADALARAEHELNRRLPVIWRKPGIAALANDLADKIWDLATIIGEAALHEDPIRILDEQEPDWRSQMPVDLSGEEIVAIIRSLIRDARERPEIRVIRLRRYLQNINNVWRLRAEIEMPARISCEQVGAAINQDPRTLTDRLELYKNIDGSPELVALLSRRRRADDENEYEFAVRPTKAAEGLFAFGADKEIELRIGQREQILGGLPIVGGNALSADMPWCFKAIDENGHHFELLAQGSCRSNQGEIYVLCGARPVSVAALDGDRVIAINEGVLNDYRILWRVAVECTLEDETGQIFRFTPDAQEIGETQYCLAGRVRHHPSAKHQLFNSLPEVFMYDDDGKPEKVDKSSLRWRPIENGDWLPLDRRHQPWGDINLAHMDEGVCLARWRLSIIPSDIEFKAQAKDESSGNIVISGAGLTSVLIENAEGLAIDVAEKEDFWRIQCSRENGEAARVNGVIYRGELSAHFSIPFPAQGAVFINPDGLAIPNREQISVTQLYGYRAQFVSIGVNHAFDFVASMDDLPPVEFRVPMGGSLTSTLSLQQFKEEFEQLFAQRLGIDRTVRVDLRGIGQELIRTLYLNKFEARLELEANLETADGANWIRLRAHDAVEPIYIDLQPSLELLALDDFTAEPLQLSWNAEERGWDLGESEEALRRDKSFFGVVSCERSDFIRPFLLPALQASEPRIEPGNPIQAALLIPNTAERLTSIGRLFNRIESNLELEDLQALITAICWFGRIHPHGSDLIGQLLKQPNVLAHLWFLTIGNPQNELKSNLERIREKCLFDWWLIPAHVWVHAATNWRDGLFDRVENQDFRDWYLKEAQAHLISLAGDCESLSATCELIGTTLHLTGYPTYLVPHIKESNLLDCWQGLFARIYQQQNEISRELTWPTINGIFDLIDALPNHSNQLVTWIRQRLSEQLPGFMAAVLLAPVAAAACLHAEVPMNESQKSDLMMAKRFHPVIFEKSFRWTQLTLSIHVPR